VVGTLIYYTIRLNRLRLLHISVSIYASAVTPRHANSLLSGKKKNSLRARTGLRCSRRVPGKMPGSTSSRKAALFANHDRHKTNQGRVSGCVQLR
jgi:hypothetical protein